MITPHPGTAILQCGGVILFTETDRGVEVSAVADVEHMVIGHVDVDFGMAKGGGPAPVFTLVRAVNGGHSVHMSIEDALITAFTAAHKEPEKRKEIKACLSEVLTIYASGNISHMVSTLDSCLNRACLFRLKRAYDRCLVLNTMDEMSAVRESAIARHVMGS